MSAPKYIENIRFKIIVDPQESVQRLKSLIEVMPSQLKSSLMNWGLALHYASEYLERCPFMAYEDGKMDDQTPHNRELPTKEIEIDFWELENFGGLLMLDKLNTIQTKHRYARLGIPSDFFEKQGFRIHGHEKGNPQAVYALGFDWDRFFLVDRRKSWEATKQFETAPLP